MLQGEEVQVSSRACNWLAAKPSPTRSGSILRCHTEDGTPEPVRRLPVSYRIWHGFTRGGDISSPLRGASMPPPGLRRRHDVRSEGMGEGGSLPYSRRPP